MTDSERRPDAGGTVRLRAVQTEALWHDDVTLSCLPRAARISTNEMHSNRVEKMMGRKTHFHRQTDRQQRALEKVATQEEGRRKSFKVEKSAGRNLSPLPFFDTQALALYQRLVVSTLFLQMVNPLDSCTDHFDMTGNFSEDDIQHLLGVMNGSHEDSSSSISNNVQAAVEAAAAACLSDPSSSKPHHEDEIEEEAKAQARSERKRCREKQRRVDVNKQFNDLTKLVAQIEQEEREEDPTVFRQSFSATNRADLIARTIAHMERLRDANKRRKTECAALQKQLQESQKAGEEIAAKYKEELCRNNHGMMMPQQNKQVCTGDWFHD